MSSWFRNSRRPCVAAAMFVVAGSAQAAQYYFQPKAEVQTEVDSNRNLVQDKTSSEGYSATVGGLWGIATPTSDTTIRPEVGYSRYPKVDQNEFRALVDLSSQFRTLRSGGSISGRFDRDATYSSELASAGFNPVNPNLPTTPETGRISTDTTRTVTTLVPQYGFDLSPRLRWGVNGIYQRVDYSGTNANDYIPYSYYLGGTSVTWAVSPRTGLTVGVFGSHESAEDDSGTVKSKGGRVALDFKWSKEFTSRVELTAERHDSSLVRPVVVDKSTTGVGIVFTTAWTGQVSKLQLSTGRTYTPSGAGGTFQADQFQAEYHRDISQRLGFAAAGRYIRYDSLAGVDSGSNYDYANAYASLKWMATRTWYVAGGLGYLRRKIAEPVGTANNGMIYVSFGYQGLGRPY